MAESRDVNHLVLNFLMKNNLVSSKEIHSGINEKAGYATVKRTLQSLVSEGLICKTGNGKGTKYKLSSAYFVLAPIQIADYFLKEIDERNIRSDFNLTLINQMLSSTTLFTEKENIQLNGLQSIFKKNTSDLTNGEFNREFERLAIDLSWKSSQIEGNTYSLLETEQLLREKKNCSG